MPDPIFEPEFETSLFINGSRKYGRTIGVLRLMEIEMAKVMRDPAIKTVYAGGALGIDSLSMKVLRTFREQVKADGPYLIVVCPCTMNELPDEARAVAERCADRIIELENRITVEDEFASFKIRNKYGVDHAKYFKAFWNGESQKSGTMHAVRYAQGLGHGVEVVRIPPPDKPNERRKAPPYRGNR